MVSLISMHTDSLIFLLLLQNSQMASNSSCECGWKSKGKAMATRAYTLHMKACPLRAEKIAGSRAKCKAMAEDMDYSEGSSILVEQPQKHTTAIGRQIYTTNTYALNA